MVPRIHAPAPLSSVLCLLLLAIPLPAQGFVDASTATGVTLPPSTTSLFGRGVCFGDFDGDGDQDLIAPEGPPSLSNPGPVIRFYRNNGAGGFLLESGNSLGPCGQSNACVAADIDNDGDLDVYLCNAWAPNQLFVNDGTGSFTEIGAAAGVAYPGGSYTASFGDYDRDGFVDLYVGNWQYAQGGNEPNLLYRNNGDNTFTDVTQQAGVANLGLTFTAVFHDYDDDGWPDIFVGNDKGYVPSMPENTTYRNNGDGTFTDVGASIQTDLGMGSMGSDFTDVFNDGGWDIFVSNTEAGHVFHEWDPAAGAYQENAGTYGLSAFVEGWAVNFLDHDNDGRQDLYVTHSYTANHLYRNTGFQTPWPETAVALGADVTGTKYTTAVVDYDDDGRMDIFQPRTFANSIFLRNTVPAGNWLKVATTGTVSNRSGIGAKVSVTVGGVTQRQQVRTGTGFLCGNDLRCHFGLGQAAAADRVSIWWPSGVTQVFESVPANQVLVAVEPALSLDAPPLTGTSVQLQVDAPGDGGNPYVTLLTGSTEPGTPLPDGRVVPATLDPLALLTLQPGNPFLPAPAGVLDAAGSGATALVIPAFPGLQGVTVHAAGATLDAAFPSGVRTLLPPLPITLQ